ncbi:hypothetical protein BDW74DRAFT_168382 [Aspergillus multicolor]|uniref:uncharacterized protein n=1 Tax=Aspergillus multicolor TaxID=41759 RepID=UPI003CCD6561
MFGLTFPVLLALAVALPTAQSITVAPQHPFRPFPLSQPRHKVCHVKSHGNGSDDSTFILQAIDQCNNGGHVAFDKNVTYTIGKAMDLTFLEHIDIDIQGKINFTNDLTYWQDHSFKYAFQNSSSFIQIGGTDVNIYGGGEINGNGQLWWDTKIDDPTLLRPILLTFLGLHGGSVSSITLRNPPNWFQLVANSSDVVFDGLLLNASSISGNPSANSGRDTYRSDNIVIQNSRVFNSDDCVSFKPNSTNILVQNLYCSGSHGISVGSLGQYLGEVDIVENVLVYNITMENATDGARIKIWPGAIGNATDAGGGAGYVRNVTYDGMHNANNDWAIELTQCYYALNQTACDEHPASLIIEDILFKSFDGTTSTKRAPYIATLVCSSPEVRALASCPYSVFSASQGKLCENVRAEGINVLSPSGTDNAICTNMDSSLLELNCTPG